MKYMRLHKSKVHENEHDFTKENKRASNDRQKVKRLSEAIQKLLTSRDAMRTRELAKDEAPKTTKG